MKVRSFGRSYLAFVLLVFLMGSAVTPPTLGEEIPCRSGRKSDTYQMELDRAACRHICPEEICGGQPAISTLVIYGSIDKYQINCRCLGSRPSPGDGGGDPGGGEVTAGQCSFLENRNGSWRNGFEVVYGSSRAEISQTCSWLCRNASRRTGCRITEWF